MQRLKSKLGILLLLSLVIMVGCSNNASNNEQTEASLATSEATSEEVTTEEETTEEVLIEKIKIVASLFPHYDFARTIAGEFGDVTLLLPPGIESHSFEPTPRDIISIMDAKIFIYTNELMEPWAHAMIENVDSNQTAIVDLSVNIELLKFDDDHDHVDSDDHGHEGEYDPHYWLDLNNAVIMVETIKEALIEAMPEQRDIFEANAAQLSMALIELDNAFFDMAKHVQSKTILSGGHFAFGYFASRYGFDHKSPYKGFSPDAEPTPRNIAALINTIKTTNAKAIFFEELIEPRVANIISEEANVELLLLHGAHNVSKDELASNTTYLEIMTGNLERLKKGLGYNE